MPDLFLNRGVCFLDKGDMQSAKKEFLAGIDEASVLPYSEGAAGGPNRLSLQPRSRGTGAWPFQGGVVMDQACGRRTG